MKHKKICLPLELVKQVETVNPGLFTFIEQEKREAEIRLKDPAWNLAKEYHIEKSSLSARDLAELALVANSAEHSKVISLNDLATMTSYFFCLSEWRKTKQIFSFSKEVQQLLCDGGKDDMKLPCEALRFLPYPVFFVELKDHPKFAGFFAEYFKRIHTNQDYSDIPSEGIQFFFILNDSFPDASYTYYRLPLYPGNLLSESIANARRQAKECSDGASLWEIPDSEIAQQEELFLAMQLLCYLSCDNKEIIESSETKQFASERGKKTEIKDTFREVTKWDVAETLTRTIKVSEAAEKRESRSNASGSSASKRPHMRRAHWHTYRIGKRDGEQSVILHFLPPVFVNGEKGELPVAETKYI